MLIVALILIIPELFIFPRVFIFEFVFAPIPLRTKTVFVLKGNTSLCKLKTEIGKKKKKKKDY